MQLDEIRVCPVRQSEEGRFQQLLDAHHYLGAVRKISETLWYAADYRGEWVALLSFSAAAWKCTVRDEWIGWDYRHQYDRLKLITNNSRIGRMMAVKSCCVAIVCCCAKANRLSCHVKLSIRRSKSSVRR